MEPTRVPFVATGATLHAAARETDLTRVLYMHTTPYNPAGWQVALEHCNLSDTFPNLIHDIIHGSPIGNPPPLTSTFLPQNLPSASLYPELIDEELSKELHTCQMSGPYSIKEVHIIFGGHFQTSPVGLVEKYLGDRNWRMICHLSKLDRYGCSTNDWIDSADFPTSYFPAVMVASYVSPSSRSLSPHNSIV